MFNLQDTRPLNCSSKTPSGSSWSAKPPVANTRRPKPLSPPPSSSIGNWSSAALSCRTRRRSPSWRDKLPFWLSPPPPGGDKVLLDRTLALSAEPSGDSTPRSIQVLSQGAADQLYLAVRLAICQLVLPPEKHVPLILDDVFASFDDQRLAAALEWLLQESQNRQILLFTCHDRERTYLAGRPGVHILTLNGGAVCSH